ncbi:hypothetical protein CF336_g9294, partial [Tilletia laevis]
MHNSPANLRFLFALLTHEGAPAAKLWESFRQNFSRDYLPYNHDYDSAPTLAIEQAFQSCLNTIDEILASFGLSNTAVGLLPAHERPAADESEQEHFAPQRQALRSKAAAAFQQFNDQQKQIYTDVLQSILSPSPHALHLIQGRAGRGKTFLLQAIINNLRGHGHLLIICGATGLSAATFDRGTTVHKRFAIPVIEQGTETEAVLQSTMRANSPNARFIRAATAIVIDELWSLPRAVIEAVDRLLRSLLDDSKPFGGKPLIGVGDPRQTAPVTTENTKQATLENSFITSELLSNFTIHELETSQRQSRDPDFSAWIDLIGDGSTLSTVDLGEMFDITVMPEDAMDFLFPPDVLIRPARAVERCMLSPLNSTVDSFNNIILQRLSSEIHTKDARDTIKDGENANELDVQAALETLALIPHVGVPHRTLLLKDGQLCSIMRNLNVERGLVKHARVSIERIYQRSIKVKLLSSGMTYLLPRINFTFQPKSSPFVIHRCQFPLRAAYATTFHGCQGLTLSRTVIDCGTPIFAHGQRYAAISRTRARTDTRIYVPAGTTSIVNNIVYPELTTFSSSGPAS